jgi:hypothetical protein
VQADPSLSGPSRFVKVLDGRHQSNVLPAACSHGTYGSWRKLLMMPAISGICSAAILAVINAGTLAADVGGNAALSGSGLLGPR